MKNVDKKYKIVISELVEGGEGKRETTGRKGLVEKRKTDFLFTRVWIFKTHITLPNPD